MKKMAFFFFFVHHSFASMNSSEGIQGMHGGEKCDDDDDELQVKWSTSHSFRGKCAASDGKIARLTCRETIVVKCN